MDDLIDVRAWVIQHRDIGLGVDVMNYQEWIVKAKQLSLIAGANVDWLGEIRLDVQLMGAISAVNKRFLLSDFVRWVKIGSLNQLIKVIIYGTEVLITLKLVSELEIS